MHIINKDLKHVFERFGALLNDHASLLAIMPIHGLIHDGRLQACPSCL
jgi:hypothetical protein